MKTRTATFSKEEIQEIKKFARNGLTPECIAEYFKITTANFSELLKKQTKAYEAFIEGHQMCKSIVLAKLCEQAQKGKIQAIELFYELQREGFKNFDNSLNTISEEEKKQQQEVIENFKEFLKYKDKFFAWRNNVIVD